MRQNDDQVMRAIESVDSLNSSVSFSNNNIDIRLQETELVFSGHSLAVSWCLMAVRCQEADFLSVQAQDPPVTHTQHYTLTTLTIL